MVEGLYTNYRGSCLFRHMLLLVIIALLGLQATAVQPDEFPPSTGSLTGDYILITEPGRYTLEQDIVHEYPVGLIIAASSVILDGQGNTIRPKDTGSSPTVGIWVMLQDRSGKAVTGVSVKNVTLRDEAVGLYAQGADSSDMPWGRDLSGDPIARSDESSARSLILTGITAEDCTTGVLISGQSGATLSDSQIIGSAGSGLVVRNGQIRVLSSQVAGSGGFGIEMNGTKDSVIVDSVLEGNEKGAVSLVRVSDVRITNSTGTDQDVVYGPDSTGVTIVSLPAPETVEPPVQTPVSTPVSGSSPLLFFPSREPVVTPSQTPVDTPIPTPEQTPEPVLTSPAVQTPLPVSPLILPREGVTLMPTPAPTETPLPLHPEVTTAPGVSPVSSPAKVSVPASIMSGIHAVIVGDTIPTEMQAGHAYQVSLELYNDGSDAWIENHHIGIMARDDTARYGPAWMPAVFGAPVNSGHSLTISFTLMAPSKPGSYTLGYQAAREGSGVEILFGRAYTRTVTIV